jgi:hypothetical protein
MRTSVVVNTKAVFTTDAVGTGLIKNNNGEGGRMWTQVSGAHIY